MKTKSQRRGEALNRRDADLSILRELSTHYDALPVGSQVYLSYNRYRIFSYDPIDEAVLKELLDRGTRVKIITQPEAKSFWQRKIKAAENDIANLKSKLA